VVIPLESVHYMEIEGNRDARQQLDLARLMEELSGFVCVLPRSSIAQVDLARRYGVVVPSFEELLPRVKRVHAAVRRVIARAGCELASALLVCELQAAGWPAVFVLGHYLAPDAPAGERGPLHAWVELDGVLLDPTRDQFSESPFTETYLGEYVRDGGDPRTGLEQLIHEQLNRQLPHKRDGVLALAAEYQLDVIDIEKADGGLYGV
jgi:hypothetical protein